MTALRIEGYVIASADGMLADAARAMPPQLKFMGDQDFFAAALDRVDLIVHGRNSYEDQPRSPQRTRIIVTRSIATVAQDPDNANATLWNPATAFEQACDFAGVRAGTAAVIGGPVVFAMFLDRYDTFWLSQAPHVRLPGGMPCFAGDPPLSPQQLLTQHGLRPGEITTLDAAHDVTVTAWRRTSSLEKFTN